MKDNFNVSQWNKKRYLNEEVVKEGVSNFTPKLAFTLYEAIKKPLDELAEKHGNNMSFFSEMFPTATSFYHELDGNFDILNEGLKVGDLEFGVNIEPRARLPLPNRDVLVTILNKDSLDKWKEDKDPNLEVVKNEDEYGRISYTIPDFNKGISQAVQRKASWLEKDKNKK